MMMTKMRMACAVGLIAGAVAAIGCERGETTASTLGMVTARLDISVLGPDGMGVPGVSVSVYYQEERALEAGYEMGPRAVFPSEMPGRFTSSVRGFLPRYYHVEVTAEPSEESGLASATYQDVYYLETPEPHRYRYSIVIELSPLEADSESYVPHPQGTAPAGF